MRAYCKASMFGAACGTLLFLATPSNSAVITSPVTDKALSDFSSVQKVSHTTQTGQCIKWTRRWNTRHGFGHRRCVQWR
jgi:hypothetical protein